MISSATGNHQKHAKLARPSYGEWGRNELAILGTDCSSIKRLAQIIIQHLPEYKIAFVDASHKSENTSSLDGSLISEGAFAEYTNKGSHTQVNLSTQPNPFQKKVAFNDCDLVLVNGNHFTASTQIIVIDEKKSLEKKLGALSNLQLILLKESSQEIPVYLSDNIANIHQLPAFSFDDAEAIVQFVKQHLQQQTPLINGLVLAGGKSTRMGRDKSELQYHNKTQRQFGFDLLSSRCRQTYLSCNAMQSKEITGMPKIEDVFLNLGPLGGILSAFQHNPDAAWLTIACDLPFLSHETIAYLISHRNPSKMATAFRDAKDEFPEPLITIWEPRAYPVLLQFLAQGYSCPRKALINSDIELLAAPDAFAFKNVNTAEEYTEALSLLRKQA